MNWFWQKITARRGRPAAWAMAFGASSGTTRMSSGRKSVPTSTGPSYEVHRGMTLAALRQKTASKPSARSVSTWRRIIFWPPATWPVGNPR